MEAMPKEDKQFKPPVISADKESADTRREWTFSNNLDGWITGSSENWDTDAAWQAESYGRKGVVVIPACNWGGDKFSWIEKKVQLPGWDKLTMQFYRHSAAYSDFDTQWADGLLKVIVKGPGGQETVYEKLYSGEWGLMAVDLSRYKGQSVIIRFENHGGGHVRLSQTTSATCDGEDALINEIRLVQTQ